MSTLYTAPGVSSSNLHKALNPHSPVAVGLLAFQQAFHSEARCRELRKRGSILRDSGRCGNPFFQLFLKDGPFPASRELHPSHSGHCFPCSAYGNSALTPLEQFPSSTLASIAVSRNEGSAPIGSHHFLLPELRIVHRSHAQNKSGEGLYAFPRLRADQVMSSRTYAV